MVTGPFSEAEDEILRRLFADTPSIEIAKMLGRGLGSVKYRAAEATGLGLTKSPAFVRAQKLAASAASRGVARKPRAKRAVFVAPAREVPPVFSGVPLGCDPLTGRPWGAVYAWGAAA